MNIKPKFYNPDTFYKQINNILGSVNYGSIEIYIQNNKITQLTVRKIVKTQYEINKTS